MSDLRDDFERQFARTMRQKIRPHDTYRDSSIQAMWEAWQAGRNSALEEAAAECDAVDCDPAELGLADLAEVCAMRIRALIRPE